MNETSGALVPLEQVKRMDFLIGGDIDLFEYNRSYLTEAQKQLLADRVEFAFVFGMHGTDPQNFLAVEKVFDHIDPEDSVICFESAGFSLIDEKKIREDASNAKTSARMKRQREAVLKSRNSVGSNYMTATNAFFYAQEFCLANGFDVHFADIDRWTEVHLLNAFKADEYEKDPVFAYELFKESWKDFSLIEVVEEWKKINNTSSMLIDGGGAEPLVLPRWGRYQAIREEYAVDRVLALALQKLENGNTPEDQKLQVITFFGAAHTKGIQQRFSDRGVGLQTIQTLHQPVHTVAEDVALTMQDVRSFMANWASIQLYQHIPRSTAPTQPSDNVPVFDDQVQATKRAVELMPSDSLFELYESFRTVVRYYDKPAEDNETPLARAIREFKSERVNPSVILQKLLVDSMHKNGMPLNEATKQYVEERSRARAELFGQQTFTLL